MKFISGKVILKYLYNQLTGTFAGFLIGMSATKLVAQFFETRGLKNLWGLASKKTIVDKDTFGNLEWIISIVIGFIVFEIFTKVVKEKIDQYFPIYRYRFFRWTIANQWHTKLRDTGVSLNHSRVVVFAAMQSAFKIAIDKYARR